MMQTGLAQDFGIETNTVEVPNQAFIFYPGNLLAPLLRTSVPDWKAGGLVRMDIITLQYRNGYIRQCEITACRQQMLGVWKGNILPSDMKNMKSSYRLTEGGQTRTIQHTDANGAVDILFRPWYPHQDLGRVTAENIGIVEMPIQNGEQALEAQYFLFPNWDDIVSGRASLPAKMRDLRFHLEERRQAAPLAMQAIADAALRACAQFEAEGQRAIQRDNEMYDHAKAKGWAWNYGMDAQLYMEQLGISRRDNLADEQANKIDRLADVLASAFGNKMISDRVTDVAPTKEAFKAVIEESSFASPVESAVESPSLRVGSIVGIDGEVGEVIEISPNGRCQVETPEGKIIKTLISKLEIAS